MTQYKNHTDLLKSLLSLFLRAPCLSDDIMFLQSALNFDTGSQIIFVKL